MNSSVIDSFVKDLTTHGEILQSHLGEITQAVLTNILSEIEARLEKEEEDFKKSRKVYNILVEALQNLYHHTETHSESVLENGDNIKTAVYYLGRKGGEYNILVANYLTLDYIPTLKARLDKINNLDKEGLRSYYKEVLNNGQYSVHGGGGLGMIDIARKSGNKLDYDFSNLNTDYGIFTLKIKI